MACFANLGGWSRLREQCRNRRDRAGTTKRVICMRTRKEDGDYTAVMIVPTGIGATIGGYAGDALPAARLLSSAVDTLIAHPNVLNGAMMYWPIENTLYVEGFALDKFAAGDWCLRRSSSRRSNSIGLILDAAIDQDQKLRHLQVADAARATLGLDVRAYAETTDGIGVDLALSDGGTSWGTIRNAETLLDAARQLVQQGCNAIAVVAKFPDDEDEEMLEAYRSGSGVDAIAGAEAIISHLVTRELGVPCAHAPSLPPLDVSATVSPKSAAEELGYTFLPCVLVGLSDAPSLHPASRNGDDPRSGSFLHSTDVDAVVVPAQACGGSAVLGFAQAGAKIIAVVDNTTAINVTPESLGIEAFHVQSYLEAAGALLAHRHGILPAALSPTIQSLSSRRHESEDSRGENQIGELFVEKNNKVIERLLESQ